MNVVFHISLVLVALLGTGLLIFLFKPLLHQTLLKNSSQRCIPLGLLIMAFLLLIIFGMFYFALFGAP